MTNELTIHSPDAEPAALKKAFDTDGYLALKAFDQDEIDRYQEYTKALLHRPQARHPRLGIDALRTTRDPVRPQNPYQVHCIFNLPLAGDEWLYAAMDPKVLGPTQTVLGSSDIDFYLSFLRLRLCKTPVPRSTPKTTAWHRDYDTDVVSDLGLVTCLTYLHDMDDESGATQVIPGSHHGAWNPETREVRPPSDGEVDNPLSVVCPAGTILFLHCLVYHRAQDNQTDQERTVFVHEYVRHSTAEVALNEAALGSLPVARQGWLAEPPPLPDIQRLRDQPAIPGGQFSRAVGGTVQFP